MDKPTYAWCGTTGKMCFHTRQRAKKIGKTKKSIYGGNGFRVYLCEHCRTWHLASR